ncbi:hypothetical protein KIW84_035869 [Lathyrus oleraceus]|uniref:Uncharacterized protein n=1 Tax=Pisum sativum TaxID=3888 RepID=A0A9D4Y7A5_PEA|nr:hypothetical protein KIW84_035869 [Pisum sativum]
MTTSLQLYVDQSKGACVELGNGKRTTAVGKSEGMEIQVEKFSIRVEAYVLELEDIDIVLGTKGYAGKELKENLIMLPQLNIATMSIVQPRKVTRWEGSKEIISWESENQLLNHCPYDSLEDKAHFVGEGSDRVHNVDVGLGPFRPTNWEV